MPHRRLNRRKILGHAMSALLQQTKDDLNKPAPAILTLAKGPRTFECFKEFFGIVTNMRTDVGDDDMSKYQRLVEQEATLLQALFA
jgi:hypothetical protein